MRKVKTSGNVRMKQLNRKKVEVWLSLLQSNQAKELADSLHIPLATFTRRALNYFVRGGKKVSEVLMGWEYD